MCFYVLIESHGCGQQTNLMMRYTSQSRRDGTNKGLPCISQIEGSVCISIVSAPAESCWFCLSLCNLGNCSTYCSFHHCLPGSEDCCYRWTQFCGAVLLLSALQVTQGVLSQTLHILLTLCEHHFRANKIASRYVWLKVHNMACYVTLLLCLLAHSLPDMMFVCASQVASKGSTYMLSICCSAYCYFYTLS